MCEHQQQGLEQAAAQQGEALGGAGNRKRPVCASGDESESADEAECG